MAEQIYSQLAKIYSHLMRFINYEMWVVYLLKISKEIKKKNLTALELACGNGKIAEKISKKFSFYVASDLSKFMLNEINPKIKNKVCCSFTAIPFKKKFDFIFSTFDSINYLTTKEKFIKMLSEVESILSEDGIFTFDASMENNSLKFQKYLNRKGEFEGIRFKQISKYNSKLRIHQNKFIFKLADGKEIEEIHNQKIYRFEDYFEMISQSNLYVANCYEAFSFENANSETERIQFVLKKRKNNVNI